MLYSSSNKPISQIDIPFLLELNKQLVIIEKNLIAESKIIAPNLNQRVKDPNDWLSDYEIDAEISFWLNESDPEYIEDDDNILCTLHEGLKRDVTAYLADGENHSEPSFRDNDLYKNQHQCWLFHCLNYPSNLTLKDMLRIGFIWTDIHVQYQNELEIVSPIKRKSSLSSDQ